ncbi:hypothetical protein H5U35_01085, partial [Candidatus Aerophobetes bacterium]|nr:hypothetical protein [Candidatus Aerophobetes bacterium]
MRVICQKQKALESVRIAQHAITSTTLPVLSYLLLHAREGVIEVQATNLETTICSLFEATVEEEGSVCLPGEKFYSILRELPEGRFYLETEENKTFVKMGEISFTLLGIPKEEFPETSKGGEVMFHLPQKTLLEVLAKTMFSAGQDEVRQNLNCILLEAETPMEEGDGKFALRAVSTDGRRLSLFNLPEPAAPASFKVLFPL